MNAPETGAGPAAGTYCRKCGAAMGWTALTPTGLFNRRTGTPETPRRLECPNVPRRFRPRLLGKPRRRDLLERGVTVPPP